MSYAYKELAFPEGAEKLWNTELFFRGKSGGVVYKGVTGVCLESSQTNLPAKEDSIAIPICARYSGDCLLGGVFL